jgi:hypothetical protein
MSKKYFKYSLFVFLSITLARADRIYDYCYQNNVTSDNEQRDQRVAKMLAMNTLDQVSDYIGLVSHPWLTTQVPNKLVREATFNNSLLSNKVNGVYIGRDARDFQDLEEIKSYLLAAPEDIETNYSRDFHRLQNRILNQSSDFKLLDNSKMNFACARFGSNNSSLLGVLVNSMQDHSECTTGLKAISAWMSPKQSLSLLGVVEEVLTGEDFKQYEQATIDAAVKMLDEIINKRVSSNLFDIVVSGFKKYYSNHNIALDKAFSLLGIYATRGANIHLLSRQLKNPDNYRFFMALAIIGIGTNYLDSLAYEQKQRLFSYPASVKTTCDSGKPYHFWLTAYFARKLLRENIVSNKTEAFKASFLSALGYQMLSETYGRYPHKPLYIETNAPYNNKIRMDLAIHMSGARFGALSTTGRSDENIDLNSILGHIIDRSESLDGRTRRDAIRLKKRNPLKFFNEWSKLMGVEQTYLDVLGMPWD